MVLLPESITMMTALGGGGGEGKGWRQNGLGLTSMQFCFDIVVSQKLYTHHCISVCGNVPLLNVNNVQSCFILSQVKIYQEPRRKVIPESFQFLRKPAYREFVFISFLSPWTPTLFLHTAYCMATSQTRGQPSLPDRPQESACNWRRIQRVHTGHP